MSGEAASVVTVAILAGGESRRMGTDKALLPLAGEALLVRTARIAASAGFTVIVAGRDIVPPGWPYPSVRFVPDITPGIGPLGGLQTALETTTGAVLAVACDMPRLSADALRWLTDTAMRYPANDGVAVRNEGQIEPLFTLYRPACLPHLHALMTTGRRSLQALIRTANFALVDAPPAVAGALANVNTPEEWAALTSEEKTIS